ncbi:twin-arginine translocase TatA/TatE family subunit [Mesorhizobium sp. M0924]|uniref:twin-arginine translocase TatA/TatE family subunit n=2 Tax=unclassified Mesorhizobium TaxID=325217 RepID=UPI001FD9D071|nr:twin-arginine translocase TatA/TatE family subunit [Mesorhizobium sp. LSHC422A00]
MSIEAFNRIGRKTAERLSREDEPMFGFGITHLVVIFVVALVVFGPEELPKVMRSPGAMMKTFNRIAGDFGSLQ